MAYREESTLDQEGRIFVVQKDPIFGEEKGDE
jgi:hypothetical protein